MRASIFILVLTLAVPAVIACEATGGARCFYIDPISGNDANPGTLAQPWKSGDRAVQSIYRAAGPLQPGDYLYLRGGIHNTLVHPGGDNGPTGGGDYLLFFRGLAGTQAQPITIKSYPGEYAILDSTGSTTRTVTEDVGVYILGSQWLRFENFEVRNTQGVCIKDYGSDIVFRNLTVHNCARADTDGNPAGLMSYGVRTTIENSQFWDSYWQPQPGRGMRGAGVQTFYGANMTVRGNTFSTKTVPLFNGVPTKTGCFFMKHAMELTDSWIVVYNNTFNNCGMAVGTGSQNARIYNNLIINSDIAFRSVDFGGPTYQVNQLFENNTIYGGRAVDTWPSTTQYAGLYPTLPKNMLIRGNIVYDTTSSYSSEENTVDIGTYMGDAGWNAMMPELRFQRNCYFNPNGPVRFAVASSSGQYGGYFTFTQWKALKFNGADLLYDATGVEANPLFVNAAQGDYRLQSNSPCATMGYTAVAPTVRQGDLNNDGQVNTIDLAVVTSCLGLTAPQCGVTWSRIDANGDNRIDVLDIVSLTRYWG